MDLEGRKINQRPKWTLAHTARNIKFSIGFPIVFYRFPNAWAIWARPFCAAVCEGSARHKTGRKLEAPPVRKLVENWRSKTGTKLEVENW